MVWTDSNIKNNACNSQWKFFRVDTCLSGVSQVPVIGPVLFMLYVNDLPDWVVGRLTLLAEICGEQ